MAKEPVMGAVKTRLARQVGLVAATAFYRHALVAILGRLAADPRWQTLLAVAPDSAISSRALPDRIARIGQGQGDLGARMQSLLEIAGPGPVIVVGSDIPAMAPRHIAAAFRALRGHDAVLGAAEDGGFWLVGLRRAPRVLRPFIGVRWSHPRTLADTLANLAGSRVARAATLSDVDSAADLARQRPLVGRRILPVTGGTRTSCR